MSEPIDVPEIVTARLVLRGWRESDRQSLAALSADPVVMEYFAETLSRAQTDEAFDRYQRLWAEFGYGFWCAQLREDGAFVGIIGLGRATFESPFTPVIEVGWRLAVEHWGKGLATEGAKASLQFGFDTTDTPDIVAITASTNLRSRRVMQRLGMTYEPALDFDHPAVGQGHRLQPHVLYRITRESFELS